MIASPLLPPLDTGSEGPPPSSTRDQQTCQVTYVIQMASLRSFDWLCGLPGCTLGPKWQGERSKSHSTTWSLKCAGMRSIGAETSSADAFAHETSFYSGLEDTKFSFGLLSEQDKPGYIPRTVAVKLEPEESGSWSQKPGWETCQAIVLTNFKADWGEPTKCRDAKSIDFRYTATIHTFIDEMRAKAADDEIVKTFACGIGTLIQWECQMLKSLLGSRRTTPRSSTQASDTQPR